MSRSALARTLRTVSFAILGLTVLSEPASARPIFYSQLPLFANGDSFQSEVNFNNQADDWTATSGEAINIFRWWGTQAGPGTNGGSFTLTIYSNNAGTPGALLGTALIGNSYTRTATGQEDFNGRVLYQYEANIGTFSPVIGTTYWLSIRNDLSISGAPGFFWHQGSGGNGIHASRFAAGSWSASSGDMAFQLESIPAPGALALLGLAGLISRRRR